MDPMKELFDHATAYYNLPLTVLLGLVVLYWLFVVVGFLGMETFDLDFETDTDVGGAGDAGGIGMTVLRFLNFGEVPAMAVVSVLIISLWFISLLGNFFFNPGGGILIAGGIFAVNLVASALLTKLAATPLVPLMRALNRDYDTHEPIVGQTCQVKSLEVSSERGQAEIERDGATVLINVRVGEGQRPLSHGESALVVEHDEEKDIYVLRSTNTEREKI